MMPSAAIAPYTCSRTKRAKSSTINCFFFFLVKQLIYASWSDTPTVMQIRCCIYNARKIWPAFPPPPPVQRTVLNVNKRFKPKINKCMFAGFLFFFFLLENLINARRINFSIMTWLLLRQLRIALFRTNLKIV